MSEVAVVSGPDSGLATAIMLAVVCMLVVPALVLGGIGYLVARGRGERKRPLRTISVTLGAALLGSLLGVVGVVLTFYESLLDPVLVLDVPPGRAITEVYLIEDPTSPTELDWDLLQRRARVAVPPSSVIRVRDLGRLEGFMFSAELSTGQTNVGASAMPAPPGIGAGYVHCLSFVPWAPDQEDVCSQTGDVLAARLRALEAGAASDE